MKQILTELKEEIDSHTIIVGGFSMPLSTAIDRSSRWKVSYEIENLNYPKWTAYPKWTYRHIQKISFNGAEYTFSSIAHRKFFRVENVGARKKFWWRKLKSYQVLFLILSGIKLEISNITKLWKFTNTWRFYNIWPTNGSKKKLKRNFKEPWDKRKWKHSISKLTWCCKSNTKREVYSAKCLH